ncbi:MAG: hypothetical protein ACXWUU_10320 [Burkholderiales bacterium]
MMSPLVQPVQRRGDLRPAGEVMLDEKGAVIAECVRFDSEFT